MIKLYTAKITDFTKADYTNAYSLLDCAIREKIDAKAKSDDKMRSLAGYILLFKGAEELYYKTDFSISFNSHGKPLCDFCYFSISHSEEYAVCAFSDRPIGVDIQKIRCISRREKYRFFTEKESRYVNQATLGLSQRYTEIFTKKEAALKMCGLALGNAPEIDTFSTAFKFETKIFDNFVLTVSCER